MALADNIRLYDIATRQQTYVESVKVWQAQQFDLFLLELAEELRKLLPRIKYQNLDALTKAQLNSFLIELRRTQSRLYSLYLEKVLEQLEDFMQVHLQVSRRVWASAYVEDDSQDVLEEDEAEGTLVIANEEETFGFLYGIAAVMGTGSGLWGVIKNAPLPANGILLQPFLTGFARSAQASVENAVRKAYANGETLTQLTDSILNRSPQGTSGIVQRIGQQGTAALGTSMQHIAQVVSAGITSGLFGRYQWYSVIDNATTQICRSRDGQIYTYGRGPLPPAHVGCRSHIGPIRGNGEVPQESFARWFARQPKAFRDDIKKSLTPTNYLSKIALILSR